VGTAVRRRPLAAVEDAVPHIRSVGNLVPVGLETPVGRELRLVARHAKSGWARMFAIHSGGRPSGCQRPLKVGDQVLGSLDSA
jgi:hypothetical protein